jgi:hypothetical protein
MENGRCCHGKERFLKFDLYTLRRVLNEQNWLPIKKKTVFNSKWEKQNSFIEYLKKSG